MQQLIKHREFPIRHQKALRYIDVVARVGSIRKAAEQLAITSTALNRQILAMEEELGVPIFDRLPTGVRLSTAGELLVHHARKQISDLARVKSQISDLAGERRGHVSIVCGQAMMIAFIPEMIQQYRAKHPGVSFEVRVCNRSDYQAALNNYSADIAVVFEPIMDTSFQHAIDVPQRLYAVFEAPHELEQHEELRLRDCISYPLALPTRQNSIRYILETTAIRLQRKLDVVIESDNHSLLRQCLANHHTLGFQISIGLPKQQDKDRLVSVPIVEKDIKMGRLYAGQRKDRTLPVAAARFLEQICQSLAEHYGLER